MIEITFSDLFLFIWCTVATGFACYFRYHAKMRHALIVALLDNDEIREDMVASFKKASSRGNK